MPVALCVSGFFIKRFHFSINFTFNRRLVNSSQRFERLSRRSGEEEDIQVALAELDKLQVTE